MKSCGAFIRTLKTGDKRHPTLTIEDTPSYTGTDHRAFLAITVFSAGGNDSLHIEAIVLSAVNTYFKFTAFCCYIFL